MVSVVDDDNKFGRLVGRTIVAVDIRPENEGTFIIILDNGGKVSFTAVGDDMTYTDMVMEWPKPVVKRIRIGQPA